MKKVLIAVSVLAILAGVALSVFVLKDGLVSIPEAAVIFAYLALVRIGAMLANRSKKAAPEEKNPSHPLNVMAGVNAAQADVAWKPAA